MGVYERIMRAAKRGTGTKLSAEDVWVLSSDTAIIDAANAEEDARTEHEKERHQALFGPPVVRKKNQ